MAIYCFSHVCYLGCFNWTLFFNIWLHSYGFSPLCILRCVIRSLFIEKVMSQLLQWYAFSPVCVIVWLTKVRLYEKALSQWLHSYGFSTVYVLRWDLRTLFLRNHRHNSYIGMGFTLFNCYKIIIWQKALSHWRQ